MLDQPTVRVGIIDSCPEARAGLERTLALLDGLELAFSCGSIASAKCALQSGVVTVCLVDLDQVDGCGTDLLRFCNTLPSAPVCLMLTGRNGPDCVNAAFAAGARGYLLKASGPDLIAPFIKAALRGGTPIDPFAAGHLVAAARAVNTASANAEADLYVHLTHRECDVLTAFAKGLSYDDTASALELTIHGVRHHVRNIYSKLAVNSRNEAVFEALQRGLVQL